MKILKERIFHEIATPWGRADYVVKLGTGLIWVGTPSHGGLLISKGLAERKLSDAALFEGIDYGSYYCYEEDEAWAIPCYESPDILKAVYSYFSSFNNNIGSIETFKRESVNPSVERYFKEYLDKKSGNYKGLKISDLNTEDIIHAFIGDKSNERYYIIVGNYNNKKDQFLIKQVMRKDTVAKLYRTTFKSIKSDIEGHSFPGNPPDSEIIKKNDPRYNKIYKVLLS